MKANVPQLAQVPKTTVLHVTMVGSPRRVFPKMMPSLYGTAYTTKYKVCKPRGQNLKIGQLVCSYPDAHRQPMKRWTIIGQLELSGSLRPKDLIQKQPDFPARLVKIPAGMYAQILYIGPYTREGPAIKRLHDFMSAEKMRIAGPHQEVYLSRPGPKAKTIIRYRVRKK